VVEKKMNDRIKRSIIRLASNKTVSASKIKQELSLDFNVGTKQRLLSNCEFLKLKKLKRKPRLQTDHIEARTVEELTDRIVECWENILEPDLQRLVDSMPNRFVKLSKKTATQLSIYHKFLKILSQNKVLNTV
jgi:hypothetical protein